MNTTNFRKMYTPEEIKAIAGGGGAGGLTYETVDLGNIDTSTGTFDLMPEASKEKIINILKNKKLLNVKIIINNYFLYGSPNVLCEDSVYGCMLLGTNNTIILTINGNSSLDLNISLDISLNKFIVANTNYTLELGYDN